MQPLRTRRMATRGTIIAALLACAGPLAPLQAQGTLFVEGNSVGIGVATPTQLLHLFGTSSSQLLVQNGSGSAAERVLFRLVNNGKTRFSINNSQAAATWTFDNDGNFTISKVGTGVNEFLVDGAGNVFIQGTLTEGSSREVKKEIVPVDSRAILEKVAQLPLAEWSYRKDERPVRHLGPMAEDFHAAFGLGASDRAISSLDGSGVALASIQALHRLVSEKESRIEALERQNADLVERLTALEEALGPADRLAAAPID